jgi:hypothetical protein
MKKLVVLVTAVVGLTACGSSSTGALPGTTPSTNTTGPAATTPTAESAPTATANYADSSGDTWTVSLSFGPLQPEGDVSSTVANGCNGQDGDYDPTRSLFSQVTGTITLTSSLPTELTVTGPTASVDDSNQPTGDFGQPDADAVFANGACNPISGVETTYSEFTQNSPQSFDFWIIYPNAVTPTSPNGDLALIRQIVFDFPAILASGTTGGTVNSVTGSGAILCPNSIQAMGIFAYFSPFKISPSYISGC